MTDTTDTGTALAIPELTTLQVMFHKPDQIGAMIDRIAAEARAQAPDLSTAKGRKAIASLAYKIAQSKTALDKAGKDLNEEARKQIAVVDAERRKIRDRFDALKDEIRKPLDDWEAAEAARVDALKARLDRLTNAAPTEESSDSIRAMIDRVDRAVIDDTWQEYLPHAAKAKDATLTRLRAQLAETERREAETAELARLRAEAAAREEADRQRREAEEAEARRIAAEKAEAERQAQIERDKAEAVARAQKDAEERANAEAERLRVEAAQKEEEYKRNIAAEAAKAEAAAKAERDRIEAEKKAEADARAKREADQAHRSKIAGDIANALRTMAGAASPEQIAAALMDGKIPHVKVTL